MTIIILFNTVFYLEKQHFGHWIMFPSSSENYSVCPSQQSWSLFLVRRQGLTLSFGTTSVGNTLRRSHYPVFEKLF
jgi:hypothetical protein